MRICLFTKKKKKKKKKVHLDVCLIPRVRTQYFELIQSVSYGQEMLPWNLVAAAFVEQS